MRSSIHRSIPLQALGVAALAAVALLAGCRSGPEVAETVFTGPSISVESSGERHVVVVQAPTPGWDVSLDHRRQAPDATRVFLTLTRPNPSAVYAQVIVDQRVRTSVRTDQPLEVFARVLDYGTTNGAAYHPAETAGEQD